MAHSPLPLTDFQPAPEPNLITRHSSNFRPARAQGYYNNICVLAKANDTYLNLNGYGGLPDKGVDPCKAGAESALHTYLGGNTVYALAGMWG